MTEQTLRERIDDLMTKCQFAGMSRRATADSILSLILSEIDKAGLTPEQIDKLDYLKNTPEFMTSRQVDVWIKKVVAAAQLEAIKKQLRG